MRQGDPFVAVLEQRADQVLVGPDWQGSAPEGIQDVLRSPTSIGFVIPRVFMDDTAADRQAILPLVAQIMAYPLSQFTGQPQTKDWSQLPTFPAPQTSGGGEVQWVNPDQFFDVLAQVLDEVPPLAGEQALYGLVGSVLQSARQDPEQQAALTKVAQEADQDLIGPLFQYSNEGVPLAHGWGTLVNAARFGTDYVTRTAAAKANIFANKPEESTYFFTDVDANGERLHGRRDYSVTFTGGQLPPVKGFWSLTLYDQHHFFAPNELGRYSLGTKNQDLHLDQDGSLTISVQQQPPQGQERSNWLPAPDAEFTLFLRAYWPEAAIADGNWTPPPVISGR